MRNGIVVIALCATVALAGCQRTGFGQPAPLSPAPVGDIQSGQLPPAGQSDFPDAPTTQGPSEQELQTVAANAPEVTRDSMVGVSLARAA